VTKGGTQDGHEGVKLVRLSVSGCGIRLQSESEKGEGALRYALLIYGNTEVVERTNDEERRRINAGVAEVVARPNVTDYLRLQRVESATTMMLEHGKTLLTDGPFVDSKDFLGGLIVVEAENLEGALAVADELQELRLAGAIEIRPVNEEPLVRA
jgi:hypothetical protein